MSTSCDAVAAAFADHEGVGSGRMFGSPGLEGGGRGFAMRVKGALVVQVPEARARELVEAGHAVFFDPGHGRLMKAWVSVSPEAEVDWVGLAREA